MAKDRARPARTCRSSAARVKLSAVRPRSNVLELAVDPSSVPGMPDGPAIASRHVRRRARSCDVAERYCCHQRTCLESYARFGIRIPSTRATTRPKSLLAFQRLAWFTHAAEHHGWADVGERLACRRSPPPSCRVPPGGPRGPAPAWMNVVRMRIQCACHALDELGAARNRFSMEPKREGRGFGDPEHDRPDPDEPHEAKAVPPLGKAERAARRTTIGRHAPPSAIQSSPSSSRRSATAANTWKVPCRDRPESHEVEQRTGPVRPGHCKGQ